VSSRAAGTFVAARAPGRVNLIGDHTDYTGGLVLPMAIDRWTTVRGVRRDGEVRLRSDAEEAAVRLALPVGDPAMVTPPWGRYVAAVAAELGAGAAGIDGTVETTVPVGAGLASSAALEVAAALALGHSGPPLELARLCQRAEHRAVGVPCGIMDQLASAAGVEGAALCIDCTSLTITPVPVPDDVDVVVVHSGEQRALAGSAYTSRAAECTAAEQLIGPLRLASPAALEAIADPVVRRRARHVITENERVRQTAVALTAGDVVTAGRLMTASHGSLRDDFEVSTPTLDALVARLVAIPGVLGARLTGAGLGGCVVALARPGAVSDGWVVRAVAGAALLDV
jgi:galactokinase